MPPILSDKLYGAPTVFTAAGLIASAQPQKRLPLGAVPPACVRDPDPDFAKNKIVFNQ